MTKLSKTMSENAKDVDEGLLGLLLELSHPHQEKLHDSVKDFRRMFHLLMESIEKGV